MPAANPVTLPLSSYKAQHVRLEVSGKMATLTLNRPDKKNPLTFESYAEIAETIGSPGAVRAVGRACGANLLAVAIPCHRAVGSNGSMSGYRWGVDRKRALLEREAAA